MWQKQVPSFAVSFVSQVRVEVRIQREKRRMEDNEDEAEPCTSLYPSLNTTLFLKSDRATVMECSILSRFWNKHFKVIERIFQEARELLPNPLIITQWFPLKSFYNNLAVSTLLQGKKINEMTFCSKNNRCRPLPFEINYIGGEL